MLVSLPSSSARIHCSGIAPILARALPFWGLPELTERFWRFACGSVVTTIQSGFARCEYMSGMEKLAIKMFHSCLKSQSSQFLSRLNSPNLR